MNNKEFTITENTKNYAWDYNNKKKVCKVYRLRDEYKSYSDSGNYGSINIDWTEPNEKYFEVVAELGDKFKKITVFKNKIVGELKNKK